MEPKLSLVYSSQAGNGIIGYGWALSGLSAINRNPRDMVHEGVCKPIEWNNNDQYYLDGSKLIAIDGEHGNHNTVYTTEQEVGTRVTQQWLYNQTNSPSWFSVKTKGGNSIHYGELGGSRQFASHIGEIFCWKMNGVEDIDGNKVEYEYANYSGEHVLRKINYGRNTNTPRYSVLLDYEDRRDKNTFFVSGSSLNSNVLLNKIKVIEYNTETIIKEYRMDFIPYCKVYVNLAQVILMNLMRHNLSMAMKVVCPA